MPGAASSISPSQLQELKTAVIQELKLPGLGLQSNDDLRWDLSGIKQEVDENAFKSESLLYATRKLYDKVKELETSSSSAAERAGGSDQRPYTPSPNVTEEMLDLAMAQVDNSKFFRRKLDIAVNKLKQKLLSKPSGGDDPSIIEAAYAVDRPQVLKLMASINEAMKEVLRSASLPDDVVGGCESILEEADSWIQHMEALHHKQPAPPAQQARPTRKVQTFHGTASLNVYEFLESFDSTYAGIISQQERVDILYKDYLSDVIRSQCLTKSDDYPGLRRWLVDQFGNLDFIINQMISALETLKTPTASVRTCTTEVL